MSVTQGQIKETLIDGLRRVITETIPVEQENALQYWGDVVSQVLIQIQSTGGGGGGGTSDYRAGVYVCASAGVYPITFSGGDMTVSPFDYNIDFWVDGDKAAFHLISINASGFSVYVPEAGEIRYRAQPFN